MESKKIPTYKILLVGDSSTGKTAFINRHRTGCWEKNYSATIGVDIHPLKFHTNKGPIILTIWDVAGQGPRKNYYPGSDGVIIMFDLTRKETYNSLPEWRNDTYSALGNKPTIIVGNKTDLKNKIKPRRITYHRKKSLKYTEVSAKTCYHFDKPFLYFARKFLGQDTYFTEAPALSHPTERLIYEQTQPNTSSDPKTFELQEWLNVRRREPDAIREKLVNSNSLEVQLLVKSEVNIANQQPVKTAILELYGSFIWSMYDSF